MEVEQDHMVMPRRYRGQKGDSYMAVSWRRDTIKRLLMLEIFLFSF